MKCCKQTCGMKFNLIAFTLTCGWLSSLNIFEENQSYEIKKGKHLTQLICD